MNSEDDHCAVHCSKVAYIVPQFWILCLFFLPLTSPCSHFSSVSTLSLRRCFPESGRTPLSQHTLSLWGSLWAGQKIMAFKRVNIICGNASVGAAHIMVPGFDLVQLNWKQLCWWTAGG